MRFSRANNFFKTVDLLALLLRLACIIMATCVSCEQCFLIDVRLYTQWIVAVFIALAFALNKILKSYTLEILCYVTLMF